MEPRGLEKPSSLGYNSVGAEERRRRSSTAQCDPPCLAQTLDDHGDHYRHPLNRDAQHSQEHSRILAIRTDPDADPSRAPTRAAPRSPPRVPGTSAVEPPPAAVRYRECQKNHAASTGGYVVDGCGEFMPGGEEGSREFFRCAACECHRSFHRKETEGEPPVFLHRQGQNGGFSLPYFARNNTVVPPPLLPQPPIHHRRAIQPTAQVTPPPTVMMSFGGGGTAAESSTEDLNMFQNYDDEQNNGFGDQQKPKKRFRTKFNQEQKDRMLEFAERLGWRIQKQDEEEVQRFCAEVNVKRQVFKVWMHNNKQAMKKKQV